MQVKYNRPVRTCVGCGREKDKNTLLRFVSVQSHLVLDARQNKPGRGAYTCRSKSCIQAALRRNAFARSLHQSVTVDTNSIYSALQKWNNVSNH